MAGRSEQQSVRAFLELLSSGFIEDRPFFL